MRRGLVVLAPGFRPFDREAELHGAEDRDEVGRIRGNLAAEPAAHLWRDDPQLVLGHAGDDRAEKSKDVWILRRVPQRQLTRGAAPLREGGARLHRVGDEPLVDDPLLDDHLGVLERRVDVAA